MDIQKLLAELRNEREQIEEGIISIERLAGQPGKTSRTARRGSSPPNSQSE